MYNEIYDIAAQCGATTLDGSSILDGDSVCFTSREFDDFLRRVVAGEGVESLVAKRILNERYGPLKSKQTPLYVIGTKLSSVACDYTGIVIRMDGDLFHVYWSNDATHSYTKDWLDEFATIIEG